MTEFEQQVAKALEMPITMFGLLNIGGTPQQIASYLAPRVATAIQASHWCLVTHGHGVDEKAALAALRGGSSA